MENSTFTQLYSLFIFAISGIIIGLFFDIFRVLRRSFKTSDLVTYIEDIIFWICTGLFILLILFKFTNGQIRSYTIIGLILGVVIYLLTISRYFIKINVKVITIIKNIVLKISNIVLFPIKKILFNPISFFIINIRKKATNFYNKMKIKNKTTKKLLINRRILNKNVEKYK